MSVDCIDSADDSIDILDDDLAHPFLKSSWNGRDVEIAEEKPLYPCPSSFEKTLPLSCHQYELIDIEAQEIIPALYHPCEREFTFAEPRQVEIVLAGGVFKYVRKACKKVLHTAKKAAELIKKVIKGAAEQIIKDAELAIDTAKKIAHEEKKITEDAIDEVKQFVIEHKKEILISVAIATAAVGAYFLSGALAAAAAGTGVAAAASGTQQKKREDETEQAEDVPIGIKSYLDKETFENLIHETSSSLIRDTAPKDVTLPDFESLRNRAIADLDKSPNWRIPGSDSDLQKPILPQTAPSFTDQIQAGLAAIGETLNSWLIKPISGLLTPYLFPNDTQHIKSSIVQTDGIKYPGVKILFNNGINTPFAENMKHLDYIKKLANNLSIEGVHNHSNRAVWDLAEVFFLNYGGQAPLTADLILENWTRFHEENKDNPHAKCLQFAHSQGVIHTKIALEKASPEIRNRVIVIAIAPATVIPLGLCYDSQHYASKRDPIHLGEDAHTLALADINGEPLRTELIKQLIANKQRIIFLEPQPGAKGIDHEFESPTFTPIIHDYIQDYLQRGGQYQ